MSPESSRETLTSLLLARLLEEPEGEACRLVSRDGTWTSITVRRLMNRAMAFAARLGPATAERQLVGVCLYHGLDLHAAFLGVLWAGHIPTMLPPPSPRMEPSKYAQSFRHMLDHIHPSSLIVDSETLRRLKAAADTSLPSGLLLDADTVPAVGSHSLFEAHPDHVALVQHSSGTTGLQKGIALSHRAILAHNRAYSRQLRLTRDDLIVSWLPLYHDMGFIACFLLPLTQGIPFVEISPFDWVLQPAILLEQIHRHRATLCWLPNFAYTFLAENVRQNSHPPDLDLSCVRAWVNCSEPVYHSSHVAFLERFRAYGVNEAQLTASYAMAENVFAVSQSEPGGYRVLAIDRKLFTDSHRVRIDNSAGGLTLVSNGTPVPGTQVMVLDLNDQPMPEDHVGELAIRGDFLFSGYFRRDDLTRDALTSAGWYRTGDLGVLHDGHIYVTGRKKDLIIIQGRNFYPSDIEAVASRVEGVIPGRVVAFGIADERSGTERLIILGEMEDNRAGDERQIALKIRNAIAQELDCTPSDVRIVPRRWLIKSTSGKLARNDNRIKYVRTFLSDTPAALSNV